MEIEPFHNGSLSKLRDQGGEIGANLCRAPKAFNVLMGKLVAGLV